MFATKWMPKLTRGAWIALGVGVVAALMVGYQVFWKPSPSTTPQVTVVQTAGTTDELDIVWPTEAGELLSGLADQNAMLTWLKIDGDGSVQRVEQDLTPRTRSGDEVKPIRARQQRIAENQSALLAEMNAFDSSGGRDGLGALQAVPEGGSGPLVFVSSLLSTRDPLLVGDLGFDAPIDEVVDQLQELRELPKGLQDRAVWLVITPTGGEQQALRQPQLDYLIELYRAIIEASGGQVVQTLNAGSAPTGDGGSAPTTPVPPAPGTFVPDVEPIAPTSGEPGKLRCVLPAPVLFAPDKDTLLDADAAMAAVSTCLGDERDDIATVSVIGHTASTGNAPDNPTAMQLSEARARRVADLIEAAGVDPTLIRVEGVGATQPLFEAKDPRNRAVEVLVTLRVNG